MSSFSPAPPSLPDRAVGFWGGLSANVLNMVGIGPFITIPLALTAMGGPQALTGWVLGAVISLCDGFVWAELGAAMPHSGGSYAYLLRLFDERKMGRMFAFLFLWQTLLNGPLNVAAGAVGFTNYLNYIFPNLGHWTLVALGAVLCLANTALLYRNIRSVQLISLVTTVIVIAAFGWIIFSGALFFDAHKAFDFPPHAFSLNTGFLAGLGSTTLIAVYDYGGYNNICQIGGEVKNPQRVIPAAIIGSIVLIALLYCGLNLSIIGAMPWREVMNSKAVVADFMGHIYGRAGGIIVAVLIMIAGWGSIYVVLLGYSRVPFAAANEGQFFKVFGRLHPKGQFPTVSLVFMGVLSALCCLVKLDDLISVLIVIQTLFQYSMQCIGVIIRRQYLKNLGMPYRMPLFPLPALLSLAGWIYIVTTSKLIYILLGVGLFFVGCLIYLVTARRTRSWPFAPSPSEQVSP
ncbi:APC family permease [Asticcacaulis sp. 201]|uniref:APC family permease n=1 Tax=Asticcacaulis sp. 201 TaxID=3028787 RepID=UPI0029165D4F|nr:amino acid permease [Asticcacaulis sp. 201]MDV6331207.1 amino acid permease [Asticcacaulis sp. 201]